MRDLFATGLVLSLCACTEPEHGRLETSAAGPDAGGRSQAMIGPQGGTVSIPSRVAVQIPAGAVDEPVLVRIEVTPLSELPWLSDAQVAPSDAYSITPHRRSFAHDVRVQLTYVGDGDDLSMWSLADLRDVSWQKETSAQVALSVATVERRELGVFAVSPGLESASDGPDAGRMDASKQDAEAWVDGSADAH